MKYGDPLFLDDVAAIRALGSGEPLTEQVLGGNAAKLVGLASDWARQHRLCADRGKPRRTHAERTRSANKPALAWAHPVGVSADAVSRGAWKS